MAHWAFQADPSRYLLLAEALEHDDTTWMVNKYADRIQVGDNVLMWLSGKYAGGYALGEVTAPPSVLPVDPARKKYWIGSEDGSQPMPRVRVRYTRRMLSHPILRKTCSEDLVLSQMLIIRQPAGTNFPITDEQYARIQEILEARPKIWTREELVLVLALYLDTKEKRFHEPADIATKRLSRLLDRDPGTIRITIGHFTNLDPDSKGKGRLGATPATTEVWAEFAQRPDDVGGTAQRIRSTLTEGGGLIRCRESSPTILASIGSAEQLRESIARFNQQAPGASERARSLLRTTEYWVFDPTTGVFGPSKFVAYVGMGFPAYEVALGGQASGTTFSGGAARTTIERALGMQFAADAHLATKLKQWGDALAGPGVLDELEDVQKKWKFLVVPAPVCRYWKIAPGGQATHWPDNRDSGLIAIGWGEAGDPRPFSSKDALAAQFRKTIHYSESEAQANVRQVWTFVRDIKPGDIIVANQGMSKVVGRGVVIGAMEFRAERKEFGNCLPVHWFDTKERNIAQQGGWRQTVMEISAERYKELFGDASPGSGAADDNDERERKPEPLPSIYEFLRKNRLHFPTELVTTYLLSLKTKPFVILSGISGTGKTKLAQAVAEWAGVEKRLVKEEQPLADHDDGVWRFKLMPYVFDHRKIMLAKAHEGPFERPAEGSMQVKLRFRDDVFAGTLGAIRSKGRVMWELRLGTQLVQAMRGSLSAGDFVSIKSERDAEDTQVIVIEPVEKRTQTREEIIRRYEFVSIRPDWLDGKEVLGFYNVLTEEFASRPFLNLLLRAHREGGKPYFAILDEMNLARVEHYFADLLSATESRAVRGDALQQEPLHLHDEPRCLPLAPDEDWAPPGRCGSCKATEQEIDDCPLHFEGVQLVPPKLKVPPNVYVTGTVNIDETTHMFSPKVLDRANVIEFNEVDLDGYGEAKAPGVFALKEGRIELGASTVARQDHFLKAPEVRSALTTLNKILAEYHLHFGYRVVNEISLYVTNAATYVGPGTIPTALDLQVLQKVLPKFHGSKQKLLEPLWRVLLFTIFNEDLVTPYGDADFGKIEQAVRNGEAAARPGGGEPAKPSMPRSAAKLIRMLRTLRAQGFVSFIE